MTREKIVYSATCLPATYSAMDGNPVTVEVRQTTIVPTKMTDEELEKAKEDIDKATELLKSLVLSGAALVDEKQYATLKSGLGAIVGAGTFIQGILKFIPKAENPLIEPLNIMAENIVKLGEIISQNFQELKLLVSEVNFFVRVMSPTSNLMRYLRDCMKNPGPEAVENFLTAYRKHAPLKLVYTFTSFLERKTTNPLLMAMDAEKIKTNTTFNKWEAIYTRIFGNFMVIDAFASGLSGTTSDWDRIMDASLEVSKSVAKWREEYTKEGDEYWKDMKKWMEGFEEYSDESIKEKADRIKAKLESYLTTDSFYIIVLNNNCRWQIDYSYYCTSENEQIVGSWSVARCKAFVYRSRKGKTASEEKYQGIKTQVDSCITGKLIYPGTLEGVIKEQVINTNIFE
ncbi:unnamed protein product [Caenorhabditis brenneri]